MPHCDRDGALGLADLLCFQAFFARADPWADCDGSAGLDVRDYICFQTRLALGCP